MDSVHLVFQYFDGLTDRQKMQFADLQGLYHDWNAKINVISRKDIDSLYEHHVLHCLAIAKFLKFKDGSEILDVGTGGGFPGIPLAILFPKCRFFLIDSIGKKINVCDAVSNQLELKNVECRKENVSDEVRKFDFVVSRAVMSAPELFGKVRKNFSHKNNNAIPNGLLCLKGGNVEDEFKDSFTSLLKQAKLEYVSKWFEEPYFETKKILYLPNIVS